MTTALERRPAALRSWGDPLVLSGRLTLVVLLVNSRRSLVATAAVAIAAIALALEPQRIRRPQPWFVLAAVLTAVAAGRWWALENHEWGAIAWCAAFGCALATSRPEHATRVSARILLGLIFALAFGWKVLASQYSSVDFFRHTLATDARFAYVAEGVAGTDRDDLELARLEVHELLHAPDPAGVVIVPEGPNTWVVAALFTTVGVILEGLIALLYLLPLEQRFHWLRQGSIFLFCATTYAAVPVVGFGLLLLCLVAAEASQAGARRLAAWSFPVLGAWGAIFALLIA